ncbi:MAG: hydrogenase formation protein HypD [archaeon]
MDELIKEHLEKINQSARNLSSVTIMEICGGHTNVIMRYGIREALADNIRLISGPGCPVCVSSQHDIDCIIEIAGRGIPVATYGDMMGVPGSTSCLEDAKAAGKKVFDVYSTTEVLEIRKKHPDVVFFGIGFETTAPMTAYLLKNNVCVYSVHKLVPPVIEILMHGEVNIDGFIDPGHVSSIIGTKAYRGIRVPQVISGFSPEQILRAIRILVQMIADNKAEVRNGYPEVVRENGNANAQKLLGEVFRVTDAEWRGLGKLPKSGLEVRDDALNAKKKYADIIAKVPPPKETGCRCGEILRGMIEPTECSRYGGGCTPEDPKGACMVSAEGTCAISYRYGK